MTFICEPGALRGLRAQTWDSGPAFVWDAWHSSSEFLLSRMSVARDRVHYDHVQSGDMLAHLL